MANRTRRSSELREAFLAEMRAGASVASAARSVGVDRTTVYAWMRARESFRRAYERTLAERHAERAAVGAT